MAVTIQTKAHRQAVCLVGQRHLGDVSVAVLTADAVAYVHRVIEVDEVGYVMDAVPAQRTVVEIAGAHRREQRTAIPDLCVASHTDFRGGQARRGSAFGIRVTVQTLDTIVTNVMSMVELHGL